MESHKNLLSDNENTKWRICQKILKSAAGLKTNIQACHTKSIQELYSNR